MENYNLENKMEQLFKDYAEEPSANCWNSISQKLDVAMPSSPTNGASSAQGFSKFITSAIGKGTAIFTAITVTGIATYMVATQQNEPVAPTKQPTVNTFSQNSTADQSSAPVANEQASSTKNTVHPFQNSPATHAEKPVASPAIPNEFTFSPSNTAYNQSTIGNQSEKSIAAVNTPTPKTTALVNRPPLEKTEDEDLKNEPVMEEKPTNKTIALPKSEESILEFPNVFTPNGDGFNDMFVIKNIEDIGPNRLVILTANGVKVFEANNYQNNWDALNVADGTYYYVFETKSNGASKTFRGAIQIIR